MHFEYMIKILDKFGKLKAGMSNILKLVIYVKRGYLNAS